jgi:hypothetical protein
MKPVIHTSMRWIQQHLRYQAYMEKSGREAPLPLSTPSPQIQTGPESMLTETGQPVFAQSTDNVHHRK